MLISLVCLCVDHKSCVTNLVIGIEHPLTVGFTDHVALQDINLLSNVYCPTTECKLDEFTSLGLCESCSSEDVIFDGDFWNGGNFADEDF